MSNVPPLIEVPIAPTTEGDMMLVDKQAFIGEDIREYHCGGVVFALSMPSWVPPRHAALGAGTHVFAALRR